MSRVSALKQSPVASDLAHLVVAAMERKGYQVDRGPGELNIVYVEGMNPDGTRMRTKPTSGTTCAW